jgi:hypothetical protein
MSALAHTMDVQLDFWTAPEPKPALAVVVRDQVVGGGCTLEDLILGAWEGLAAHQAIDCPVCDGQMSPVYGSHARPVQGACRDCGSRLS